MTGLLVSVRDAGEAALAVEAGVDLVDVKEPSAGPLGAASLATMAAIVDVVAGRRPLSVALGELAQFQPERATLPPGIRFAKLGLSACAGRCDWPGRWQQVLAALPASVAGVAVVYADHQQAGSPQARPVLSQAVQLGCQAILVDTFDKQSGGLLEHWSIDEVEWLIGAARDRGLLSVLAGRLTVGTIERLLPLEPDYVAVRGAACEGDRGGKISAERLAELVALVASRRVVENRRVPSSEAQTHQFRPS